ncbi:HalOD1 output domain-containing protein [Haladaptatus sp. CMAA 1911]|uniref:HalOD1 output domain-containing protein n=1 Tax=unclassified Haladaptatus TaxID=2622732 RepID=UPI003754FC42
MDDHPERRNYYADDVDTPLSEVVLEAVEAHESASLIEDEFSLYDHISPTAIDMLFEDTDDVSVSVRIHLTNVTVSIWSDGGIDIRVTDEMT